MNTLTKGFAKRVLSALLATIMVFSLGIVGLTSASAADAELAETGANNVAGGHVYFDNSKTKWTDSNIQLVIGHSGFSRTYTMTKVDAYLYYVNLSDSQYHDWGDATYYAVIGLGSKWGDGKWGSDNLKNATHYTAAYTTAYSMDGENKIHLITTNTGNNGTAIDITYQSDKTSDYTKLNHKQIVYAYGANYGTTTYSANANAGTVKVAGKSLTGLKSLSGSSATTTSLGFSSSTSREVARATQVTLTATPADGYEFIGWSTTTGEGGIVSTDLEYKYYSQIHEAKYYALFRSTTAPLSVDAYASETEIYVGTDIEIVAQASQANATYVLKDAGGNQVGDSNSDGIFTIDTTNFTAGTYSYTVEATATVSGQSVTAVSDVITVTVLKFGGLVVTPVAPSSVEFGDTIDIVVTSNTDSEVTYVLKDGKGNVLATNTTGIFNQATNAQDKDTTKTYVVEATAVVGGTTYTSNPVSISVNVTAISNTRTINIYFKSTSTKGFAPIATVTGMYETLTDVKMTKSQYIISNETETADYWWYVVSTKVSETNSNLSFNVKSSRYDMESTVYFSAVDGVDDYYFAIDNLYYTDGSNDIVNVTDWDPVQRSYCENAVHMLYDADYDTEEELVEFATKCIMGLNGDVNNDGAINIKDATYLQKSLVNLAELGSVGEKVSDFDNDGVNTIKDATAIQKAVAGL